MGLLTDFSKGEDSHTLTIKSHNGYEFKRKVPLHIWNNAFIPRANTNNYIIFIRKDLSKKFTKTQEIAVIPINSLGLVSESSYEEEFYDMLIRNGLLFEKPYEITDHIVYPFVPDALK